MPLSPYIRRLRRHVGRDLLLIPSVTVVVFDERRRMLLVRHTEGNVWVAPGGSIEPNESPADAAVREMWEEARLLVEPARVLGVYGGPEFLITYASGDQVTYLMTVFECRILQGQMQPDGFETLELAYFAESELASLNLAPGPDSFCLSCFNTGPGRVFRPPPGSRPPGTSIATRRASCGGAPRARHLLWGIGAGGRAPPSRWLGERPPSFS
jgi:8-oxo-dGTP diphosphatase